MRVLVACECSGVVREAFRAHGHDAWSCDLKPADDGSRYHLEMDARKALELAWDLLIGHPPCRYLSVSGMHWTTRGLRDPRLTLEAIAFAELLWSANVKRIALENPVSVLSTRSRLGKATQKIQPYHFGEDASKGTCLWLRNLPALSPTLYVEPRAVCGVCGFCEAGEIEKRHSVFSRGCPSCGAEAAKIKPRWSNQTNSGQNKLGPSAERAAIRAVTYAGPAKAMADQWGRLL